MSEKWKWAIGYEGSYEVSDFGRVRSYKTKSGQPKMRTLSLNQDGYPNLVLCKNGRQILHRVHALVLEAFIGPRPKNFDGSHLNGIRDDNRLVNLKWCSKKENQSHRKLHGTDCKGETHQNSKLKASDVLLIRELHGGGIGINKLGRMYNVDKTCIWQIAKRKAWTHL